LLGNVRALPNLYIALKPDNLPWTTNLPGIGKNISPKAILGFGGQVPQVLSHAIKEQMKVIGKNRSTCSTILYCSRSTAARLSESESAREVLCRYRRETGMNIG
jgi:hypothetical protein